MNYGILGLVLLMTGIMMYERNLDQLPSLNLKSWFTYTFVMRVGCLFIVIRAWQAFSHYVTSHG